MESGEGRVDRISSLPDCLIDCILSHLTDDFGVVVKTSVLSKRWRFCWTRVRNLYFDLNFLNKYAKPRKLDVVTIAESILSRHDGSVDHFSLYADSSGRKSREFDVYRWMKVLSEKKICGISLYIRPQCYVGIPSCILSCPTLAQLSLHSCDFGSSADFGGFTNLVSLQLYDVKITGSLLETVISNSPLLRYLNLEEICIEDDYLVAINAPGLQSLSISQSGKFCLIDYPNLTCADLYLELEVIEHGTTCKLDSFTQVMPRVESLTLHDPALTALAIGDIPIKLTTTLENLKFLEFSELDILSVDQLLCVFCLIRSSPNLESLKILVMYDPNHGRGAAVECYEAQGKLGILSRLSTLKIDYLIGDECEVKLISTFFNCCPMLVTVLFSSSEYIESESEEWLFEELKKLQRPEAVTMKFTSQQEGEALNTSSTD